MRNRSFKLLDKVTPYTPDAGRGLLFLFLVVAGGLNLYCTRTKYICSAYQSAFYFDKAAGEKKFALKMAEDSTPLIEDLVKKTDVLLIAPMSKKRKEKSWETVPMITVFPPKVEPDSGAGIAADSTAEEEEEGDEPLDKPKPAPGKPQPKPAAKAPSDSAKPKSPDAEPPQF